MASSRDVCLVESGNRMRVIVQIFFTSLPSLSQACGVVAGGELISCPSIPLVWWIMRSCVPVPAIHAVYDFSIAHAVGRCVRPSGFLFCNFRDLPVPVRSCGVALPAVPPALFSGFFFSGTAGDAGG
jgi:hypothetical protein